MNIDSVSFRILSQVYDELTKDKRPLYAIGAIFVFAAVMLRIQGRVIWCQTGDLSPWSWDIWSTHNSQHLIDPYTFTHILHGVLEFWLLSLIFAKVPPRWRLVMAVMIEAVWEIAENSSFIIERYRAATISLDYFGDSIINSLSDITACATGFLIAYKLRFWKSFALFMLVEAVLIVTIRDSLVLNIIMLIYPIDAVKHWQMAM